MFYLNFNPTDSTLFRDCADIAKTKHAKQRYGNAPFTSHLCDVVQVLRRFRIHDTENYPPASLIFCAALLHDVIEDTETSVMELDRLMYSWVRSQFLEMKQARLVLAMVCAVTDEPGRNRKERAEKTYPKIAANRSSSILKMADRIANIEASIMAVGTANDRDLLGMYAKEHDALMSYIGHQVPVCMAEWSNMLLHGMLYPSTVRFQLLALYQSLPDPLFFQPSWVFAVPQKEDEKPTLKSS